MRTDEKVLLPVLAFLLAFVFFGDGSNPLAPIDSPFPAEGRWMLIAHQSQDDAAVRNVSQAGYLRKFFGENLTVVDGDVPPKTSPAREAFQHLRDKHPSGPAFVARIGSRAIAERLTNSLVEDDAKLRSFVEGAR